MNRKAIINADVIDVETGEVYLQTTHDFYVRDFSKLEEITKVLDDYELETFKVDADGTYNLYMVKWV